MYKIGKLANGLKIIGAPLPGTKTITALVMAATGSRFENKKNSGISHFLEHLFFKGTNRRPSTLAIASQLDQAGGEYNAFTGKEYTGFFVKAEAGRLALALDILSDILLHSKFDAEEIEREKGVVMEELNMYLDNPLYYLEDLFEQCLYGDTPAGRDTLGSRQTIAKFSRRSLVNYLNSQYSPPQMIICLAGRVKSSSVGLAQKYFKDFKKKNYVDKLKTNDGQTRPRLKLHFKKTDQAHLSLGVRAVPYAHADELIVKIISLLLGGTMSSRLFIELRERRGLAYYVRTHQEAYTDSGYLTTQAGVPLTKLEQAVKIILSQYRDLAEKKVGDAELNKTKQCLIGRAALQLESSEALASWYGRQAILLKEQKESRGILTPEDYFARIKTITAADVRRAAEKIFAAAKLNLAVIGPYGEKNKLEKILHF